MKPMNGEHRRVIPMKELLARLASLGGSSPSLRSLAIHVAGGDDCRYGERMVERLLAAKYARLIGDRERGYEAMAGWVVMTDLGWRRQKQFEAMASARPCRATHHDLSALQGSLSGREEAFRGRPVV